MRNAALSLVSVLLTSCVLEVLLRAADSRWRQERLREGIVGFRPSPDRELVYECVPLTWEGRGPASVVLVGDSVASHWICGARDERQAAMAGIIRRELGVDVDEETCSGYSTTQQLVLLRRYLSGHRPRAIAWVYVLNDPADPVWHSANRELGRFFHHPPSLLADFVQRRLLLVREAWRTRGTRREYHEVIQYAYWEQTFSQIHALGELSRQARIPIVFAIHPVFEAIGRNFHEYSLAHWHARLAHVAGDAGLLPVDLLGDYARSQASKASVRCAPDDPWHPNERGHEIAGQALARALAPLVR